MAAAGRDQEASSAFGGLGDVHAVGQRIGTGEELGEGGTARAMVQSRIANLYP